jgi:hypothetical protein
LGEHPPESDSLATAPIRAMKWWTLKKLRSRFPRIRRKTVEKLAARDAQEAVKLVAPMVADPDLQVRKVVVQALTGSKDGQAVAALVKAKSAGAPPKPSRPPAGNQRAMSKAFGALSRGANSSRPQVLEPSR